MFDRSIRKGCTKVLFRIYGEQRLDIKNLQYETDIPDQQNAVVNQKLYSRNFTLVQIQTYYAKNSTTGRCSTNLSDFFCFFSCIFFRLFHLCSRTWIFFVCVTHRNEHINSTSSCVLLMRLVVLIVTYISPFFSKSSQRDVQLSVYDDSRYHNVSIDVLFIHLIVF